MGRAVVLIFFVIGFIVFAFIRHASAGVKAAYKAVNNPEFSTQPRPDSYTKTLTHDEAEQDQNARLVNLIYGSLSLQANLMGGDFPKLPDQAQDDYSIGYVLGFSDAGFQRRGIKPDAKGFALMAAVFIRIFGPERGPGLLRRASDLQTDGNPTVTRGVREGLKEFNDWATSGGENIPMGWAEYVQEMAKN